MIIDNVARNRKPNLRANDALQMTVFINMATLKYGLQFFVRNTDSSIMHHDFRPPSPIALRQQGHFNGFVLAKLNGVPDDVEKGNPQPPRGTVYYQGLFAGAIENKPDDLIGMSLLSLPDQ